YGGWRGRGRRHPKGQPRSPGRGDQDRPTHAAHREDRDHHRYCAVGGADAGGRLRIHSSGRGSLAAGDRGPRGDPLRAAGAAGPSPAAVATPHPAPPPRRPPSRPPDAPPPPGPPPPPPPPPSPPPGRVRPRSPPPAGSRTAPAPPDRCPPRASANC